MLVIMLQLKLSLFLILISMIVIFSIGIITGENIKSVFGQTFEDGTNNQMQKSKNNNNNDDDKELTTVIKVKIIKQNIDLANHDHLKIVGYLNGEGQTKYIDLKEIKKEEKKSKSPTINPLTVNLNFNKSNDISSTMIDDEYYICAYVLAEDNDGNIKENSDFLSQSSTTFPLYDCDEGNIGLSTSKDTVTLFSTMKKYGESKATYTSSKTFYSTNQQKNATSDPEDEVKITINVPISDAKDIHDMNVVSMVKGEYQIKTIDVQKELKNGNDKNDKIPVPFAFERQTEVGPIQPGDLFFGCVTSDEFPDQNSDCEKRMLKDLDVINTVCARKDSSC
jgi:hypothetical protein